MWERKQWQNLNFGVNYSFNKMSIFAVNWEVLSLASNFKNESQSERWESYEELSEFVAFVTVRLRIPQSYPAEPQPRFARVQLTWVNHSLLPSILEPNTHSFSCFAPPNSCCCAVSWLNEQHAEDRTLWSPIHARQMGCDTHAVHAEEFCGAQLKCVIMCDWLDVQKVWSIILRRSAASSGAPKPAVVLR